MGRNSKRKAKKLPVCSREEKKQRESALVLTKNNVGTSVFYHNRQIIYHTEKEPFAEVVIKSMGDRRGKAPITKKIPLSCAAAEQTDASVKLAFQGKGRAVILELIEEEKQLQIKIKKNTADEIRLYFPRGTNESTPLPAARKSLKRAVNPVFSTKNPNACTADGLLYNLKTAKNWSLEETSTHFRFSIAGEKAKLFIIRTGSPSDNLSFYYSQIGASPACLVKQGVFFTSDIEKAADRAVELTRLGIGFRGLAVPCGLCSQSAVRELVDRLKLLNKELLLKIKPYIPIEETGCVDSRFLLKEANGAFYTEVIDSEKHFAVNLADEEARRRLQNLLRAFLDCGVRGFIAECGRISDEAPLPREEKYCYSEVWYILWQRLVRQVADEYPSRLLLLRHNGPLSVKFGAVMTDEASWRDIDDNRIKNHIDRLESCGMGVGIITELGGLRAPRERKWAGAEKWFSLCKNMPIILFGRVPDKIIKKYYHMLNGAEAALGHETFENSGES